jgi:hypothetical protein
VVAPLVSLLGDPLRDLGVFFATAAATILQLPVPAPIAEWTFIPGRQCVGLRTQTHQPPAFFFSAAVAAAQALRHMQR